VAGAEDVVQALLAVEEAAQSAGRADAVEVGAVAAGEQLVHVALVGHVEDELVLRGAEDAVQRDRELDHAEVGAHVAAVLRGDGHEALTDLLREERQLPGREGLDVGRAADGREERHRALRVFAALAQLLDAQFGGFERLLAGLQEAHAFLILRDEGVEDTSPGLEGLDELLELLQFGLEAFLAGSRGGFLFRAHGLTCRRRPLLSSGLPPDSAEEGAQALAGRRSATTLAGEAARDQGHAGGQAEPLREQGEDLRRLA
jgi:hypothetical protein